MSWMRRGLFRAVDDFTHLENRQEHADDHAANDDAENDDQNWLDERRQPGQRGFDFFVEEVGDAFEHVVNFAGLFAGADHADDHVGENGMFAEGDGDAFTALDVGGGVFDRFFHDDVADGLGDDLQNFQNRHAAADQRSQRARESPQTNLVRDAAKDRELDAARVPNLPPGLGFEEVKPSVNQPAASQGEQQKVFLQ